MGRKLEYIAKPLWRWIFPIPFGFMAGYNILRQEMNPNLPPLINIVSEWHWSVWVLILLPVIMAIVIEGLWRYNRDENQGSNKDYPIVKSKATEQGQSLAISGDDYAPIIQQVNTERLKEIKERQIIGLPIKTIQHEGESIGVIVSNPNNDVDCRCTLDSIELNGEIDEKLRLHLASKSPLVSWSQGSDGTKRIFSGTHAMLNIVTLTLNGLQFNMQSGDYYAENGKDYGVGEYKLNLSLRGRVGEEYFEPIRFRVLFNCWHKPSERHEEYIPEELDNILDEDTIRLATGYTDMVTGYLYINIIREDGQ